MGKIQECDVLTNNVCLQTISSRTVEWVYKLRGISSLQSKFNELTPDGMWAWIINSLNERKQSFVW